MRAGNRVWTMMVLLSRLTRTVAWLTTIASIGLACGSTDSAVDQPNGQSNGGAGVSGGGSSGSTSTGGGTVDGSAGTVTGSGGSSASGGSSGAGGAAGSKQ